MTEKKAAKNTKPNFFQRFANGFVNFFKKIGNAFKGMWHELKKVSWQSKKDVFNYSLIVFAFMVVMGVIIGLIDFGSGALIDLIVKL